MAKVDGITVCVNYADYLKYSIGNAKLFNSFTVITVEQDKDTIDLCEKNGVKYVFSERLLENGGFHKGKAINDGLAQINPKTYVCHVDADIILPPEIGPYLEKAAFCNSCIYGLYGRYNIETPLEFAELMNRGEISKDEVETEFRHAGYFQLWYIGLRRFYPEQSNSAGLDDIMFLDQFQGANRKHMDFFCLHLGPKWVNHNGRVSPKFE